MADEVLVYALSTCPWCRKTKQWLIDNKVQFRSVDVDMLPDAEQDVAADTILELSGGHRFPVVVVNGEVIVGYDPQKLLDTLKPGVASHGE